MFRFAQASSRDSRTRGRVADHRFLLLVGLAGTGGAEVEEDGANCGINTNGCPNGLVPDIEPPLPLPAQLELQRFPAVTRLILPQHSSKPAFSLSQRDRPRNPLLEELNSSVLFGWLVC